MDMIRFEDILHSIRESLCLRQFENLKKKIELSHLFKTSKIPTRIEKEEGEGRKEFT